MSRRALSHARSIGDYVCTSCRLQQRRSITTSPGRRNNQDIHPSQSSNLLETLQSRGLLSQLAGSQTTLNRALASRKLTFYAGIDPTAPSLHLGHLLPLMVLFWTVAHGHNAISLIGGATARVGDPSGRLTSRDGLGEDVRERNFEKMYSQVGSLWGKAELYMEGRGFGVGLGQRRVLDNSRWLGRLGVLDFLGTLGVGMRIGAMLGRDTVKNKLEKGDGMSFAEFTYPLLQGWDWWHMFHTMDTQIQVGGSDQYGNIIAGIDAVKHIAQSQQTSLPQEKFDAEGRLLDDYAPVGLTVPLLTTAGGEKFGKSAGNAVWLDPEMTSSFDLYGFLLRTADADIERYLNLFTFIPKSQITEILTEHNQDPGKRKPQHLLALEVLSLVHGEKVAKQTQREHQLMRNPSSAGGDGGNTVRLPRAEVVEQGWPQVLFAAGLANSKSAGFRMVRSGAVYVATKLQGTEELAFSQIKNEKNGVGEELLVDRKLLVRVGKWKVTTIEVI